MSAPQPPGSAHGIRTPGLLRRGAAALLDTLPALGVAAAVVWARGTGSGPAARPSRWNPLDRFVDLVNTEPGAVLLPASAALATLFVWHLVGTLAWSAGPGKRLFRLRFVDERGERPGLVRATIHALLRVSSLVMLGAGHLWWIADPERRTLYDRVTGLRLARDAPAQPSPERRGSGPSSL